MRLFDWASKNLWLEDVSVYASSLLNDKTQKRLKKDKPDCWSDNFDWLEQEHKCAEAEFSDLFSGYYTHVRCFHGGRPIDIGSYIRSGILGQVSNVIEDLFLQIFSDIPKSSLEQALSEFATRKVREHGKIWVVLELDELIQHCGHYLIQGSEYIMALAASLSRIHPGEDYRLRLRTVGIPTIFEVHVPTSYFSQNEIDALARLVLSEWGQKISGNHLGMSCSPCLVLHRSIEPEFIAGHTHPSRICDPHFGNRQYINPSLCCEFCI
ncbi:hypothetical protein GCM10027046_25010 [Uliginosibacterium flavum]|uniref:Uncharacterized protein n=1 Tax=Uliginosibacterium flavum TaxID=1396831 RepID=A0ABV2TKI5_9RHOO